MVRTGWIVLGCGVVLVTGVAVLAVAAPRSGSLLSRLRAMPMEFRTAYAEREAELRAALLPSDADVAQARTAVARRRAAGAATAGADHVDASDDDLPYSFF